MHVGVQFPNTELGIDPVASREFIQGAEQLGFHHVTAFEHVLGTQGSQREGKTKYTPSTPIHEPLTLFSYAAGFTSRIQFVPSILVLPQRQTVLVAKQAAELDILSGGRLRMGVGIGWNRDEFRGLGMDFGTRAVRVEEQLRVLRMLWTQEMVTFHGKWHDIEASGITFLPTQQPIPLWMGGSSEAAVRRIGRIGDGWMPMAEDLEQLRPLLSAMRDAAREAGRDPADIGLQGRFSLGLTPREEWSNRVQAWKEQGATHLVVNTRGAGNRQPDEHLKLAETFLKEMGKAL